MAPVLPHPDVLLYRFFGTLSKPPDQVTVDQPICHGGLSNTSTRPLGYLSEVDIMP